MIMKKFAKIFAFVLAIAMLAMCMSACGDKASTGVKVIDVQEKEGLISNHNTPYGAVVMRQPHFGVIQ